MPKKRTYDPNSIKEDKDGSETNLSQTSSSPPATYIDHRLGNDLAMTHSSPARTRARRRTNSLRRESAASASMANNEIPNLSNRKGSLPLTNHNLHSFEYAQANGALALDMDQFAKEQRQLTGGEEWSRSLRSDSIGSMEFGGSNPSSDHSSDSTSLDDVWAPDYYDHNEQKREGQWPDLLVLKEFVDQELKELEQELEKKTMIEPMGHQSPRQPLSPGAVSPGHNAATFGNVTVAQESNRPNHSSEVAEDSPLLINRQVNEVESLHSAQHSLRVRPPQIQPWHKSKEMVSILNKNNGFYNTNSKDKKKDLVRYTYFREDLEKTIHAANISGLFYKDGEYLDLEELFQPPYYSNSCDPPSKESKPNSSATSLKNSRLEKTPSYLAVSNLNKLTSPKESIPSEQQQQQSQSDSETQLNPFWLDVLDPTEEEMKVLSRTFGIHPLTTEDIYLGEAREKVEIFKSYYFVCFTAFDVIHERKVQRAKEQDRKMTKLQEMYDNVGDDNSIFGSNERKKGIWKKFTEMLGFKNSNSSANHHSQRSFKSKSESQSLKSKGKKIRDGELSPLNMYMIVFKEAVITFHFSATPHPINVRRRARMLRDYLTVSSDWICYALIDDITDSYAPMIESIEVEVNAIEDAILKMHSGDTDSDTSDVSDSEEEKEFDNEDRINTAPHGNVFFKMKRTKSTVEGREFFQDTNNKIRRSLKSAISLSSKSKSSHSSGSFKLIGWKRKGDMLRRIGECRKRVMSVLRLLGSKADVIKGFSKRYNEVADINKQQEIGMYLGDIQDHIVTMVQSLNHYEKLLARFHSNYLAQINIDMTKVNNDTNDILGKVTILGTIVLPINVVTGLWGMNCIVPGQDVENLNWFYGIVACMILFSVLAYNFAQKVTGL